MINIKDYRKIILGFLFVLTFGISSSSSAIQSNEELNKNIEGTWVEESAPNSGSAIFYKDGRYEARFKSNSKVVVIAKGKWWIKDGKLYNTIFSVEPPIIPIQKEPYIDIIVDISRDVMTLIDDNGLKYRKLRIGSVFLED